MALMMIGKQKLRLPIDGVVDLAEMVAQHGLLEQLFLQPDRDRLAEGLKAPRRKSQVGLEQALEFEERFFVEHDVVEVRRLDIRRRKTIVHGRGRKAGIVLPARK